MKFLIYTWVCSLIGKASSWLLERCRFKSDHDPLVRRPIDLQNLEVTLSSKHDDDLLLQHS
jgi:hypothetical protein